jgi:hypothetical protein
MQILIQVLCTKGRSIRQAIADDPRIDRYALQVTKEAQPGGSRLAQAARHRRDARRAQHRVGRAVVGAQRARRHARLAAAEPDRRATS